MHCSILFVKTGSEKSECYVAEKNKCTDMFVKADTVYRNCVPATKPNNSPQTFEILKLLV